MRVLIALLTITFLASHAPADIPPPPPPKGKKYVSVEHSIAMDKVTGYVFLLQDSQGPGAPRLTYTMLKLTDKPLKLPTQSRHRYITVAAIPEAEAKKFATEAELTTAFSKSLVNGVHLLGFEGSATIPEGDKRNSISYTHIITGVDAKKGIIEKKTLDGDPIIEGKPQSRNESLPGLIAGISLAAAAGALGLWLIGRTRRA